MIKRVNDQQADLVADEESFEFADIIARHLSDPVQMLNFTRKVMENAEEGDAASLKMIQQALVDVKYRNDNKQIVTNEQLRTIIGLAANRLNSPEGAWAGENTR